MKILVFEWFKRKRKQPAAAPAQEKKDALGQAAKGYMAYDLARKFSEAGKDLTQPAPAESLTARLERMREVSADKDNEHSNDFDLGI